VRARGGEKDRGREGGPRLTGPLGKGRRERRGRPRAGLQGREERGGGWPAGLGPKEKRGRGKKETNKSKDF
jgi:hypothetical protein